jgi:SMC interacting uncharacterized protein involved in chromosome segregation
MKANQRMVKEIKALREQVASLKGEIAKRDEAGLGWGQIEHLKQQAATLDGLITRNADQHNDLCKQLCEQQEKSGAYAYAIAELVRKFKIYDRV